MVRLDHIHSGIMFHFHDMTQSCLISLRESGAQKRQPTGGRQVCGVCFATAILAVDEMLDIDLLQSLTGFLRETLSLSFSSEVPRAVENFHFSK